MKNYKHILCTSDFTPFSDEALSCAADLAKQSNAKLTVLHVIDQFPVNRSNELIAPEDVDPKAFREQKAMELLDEQIQRIAPDSSAEKMVTLTSGAAGEEVIADARASGADLIVIGSHGHKGWAAELGSTTKAIREHAPCEVIVIEPGEHKID